MCLGIICIISYIFLGKFVHFVPLTLSTAQIFGFSRDFRTYAVSG